MRRIEGQVRTGELVMVRKVLGRGEADGRRLEGVFKTNVEEI